MNQHKMPDDYACPKCGHQLDVATDAVEGTPCAPKPGDLSVCGGCGAFLRFGERNMVLLTTEEFSNLHRDERILMVRCRFAVLQMKAKKGLGPAYARQLEAMEQRARAWRETNPGRTVRIQFNYPPGVAVIQPISEALKTTMVTTNEAGLELIKALGPWDATEPTVLMVRVVLELDGHAEEGEQLNAPRF